MEQEPFATGGSSTLWRAKHLNEETLYSKVAVKRVVANDHGKLRAIGEARLMDCLFWRGIPKIFDLWIDREDAVNIAMEFIEGCTLDDMPGSRTKPEVCAHVAKLLDVVQRVHDAGVLHRDLKCANVLLSKDGDILLTDFNSATYFRDPSPKGSESRIELVARLLEGRESIVGTPHYRSPEGARYQPATIASEVYAIGVILFRQLTGRFPIGNEVSSPLELLKLIGSSAIDLPAPEIVEQLGASLQIALKAMKPDPAERYPSAAAMARELRDAR